MPKVLDDRVKAIMRDKSVPRDRAYAIATASLQKEGKMQKGSQKLTKKSKR